MPKYTKFLANFRILIAISQFVDQSSPTLQRRFPIDDSLLQSGDICYKVTKWCTVVENYVFRLQNFRGEGPPKLDAEIFVPAGTHHVEKFGAITPTDPDDISQSTPDFWPIFEF